jgi:DNA-binding NarL/FixJ family response regulator
MTILRPAIRLLIVDDHPVVRDGLVAIISSQEDMAVAAEASTGQEAIDLHRSQHPDVTLMDLGLPDIDGVEAISAIRGETPNAKIIVLTTFRGDIRAMQALKAGAQGYLLKGMFRGDLLDAIRVVYRSDKRVLPEVALDMAEFATEDLLTRREIEVLIEISAGNANKTIADHISVSEDTVKTHVKSILAKLSANDRTHAVTIGLRRGYIKV